MKPSIPNPDAIEYPPATKVHRWHGEAVHPNQGIPMIAEKD